MFLRNFHLHYNNKLSLTILIVLNVLLIFSFVFANNSEKDNKKKAEEYYKYANDYIQMSQINKAKIMLKKALELDPDSMKINRLYQNVHPYKDIIGYYKEKYEANKEDPKWIYLYYRLLAKEDMQEGCKKIREAEKKYPDFVYLQLASCTCDVGNLNWAAALAGLNNIIKRKDAPVDAYENLLRLYSLSENTHLLLPTCKEALAKFQEEASLYKICIGYSEEIVSLQEKREILNNAIKQFNKSHQLPEIIFSYARSLKNENEKISYLKMLWNKYPSNKVSVSIYPILWAYYTKAEKDKLLNFAKDTLQENRVGEALMYSNAIDYLLKQWEKSPDKIEIFLDSLKITDFNWQGILLLLEHLIKDKFYIKKADNIFPLLIDKINKQPHISKDYLFRALITYARNFRLGENDLKSYEYYKKAVDLREISMNDESWLEYVELLANLNKKDELLKNSAKCYVNSLNEKCYKYNKKFFKEKDFYKIVNETRRSFYPKGINLSIKTLEGAEILNFKLNKYNVLYIIYAGSEEVKELIKKDAEEIKKLSNDIAIYIMIVAETEEEAKEFYKNSGFKYPTAFMPQIPEAMYLKGVPSIVVLNKEGYILANRLIDIENKNSNTSMLIKALLSEEKWY